MTNEEIDYIHLSKEISFILRHRPEMYNIKLDENGFVSIDTLLSAINNKNHYNKIITRKDLDHIITTSNKKRYEIIDNNIKALYGHSKTVNIKREPETPPDTLYHGTSHNALDSIKTQGLLSMSRNYVHFSVDIETALIVGKRRDPNPIILQIDSKKAHNDGIKFYFGNDGIWLSDTLPPQYIKIIKE